MCGITALLLASVDPSLQGYDRARTEQFYRILLDRLRALPGVKMVGMARFELAASCPPDTRANQAALHPVVDWCPRLGSNQGPVAYQATALSN